MEWTTVIHWEEKTIALYMDTFEQRSQQSSQSYLFYEACAFRHAIIIKLILAIGIIAMQSTWQKIKIINKCAEF